jgi:anti-sigma factor RsiW
MNGMAECEQTLLVQADFDGELDAAQAAALVRHREECAECRAVQEKLVRARALMRGAPRYAASQELRELLGKVSSQPRELRALGGAPADAEARSDAEAHAAPLSRPATEGFLSAQPTRRTSWRHWPAGWAAAAAVATVAVILSFAQRSTDLSAQLVNNHLRALQLDSHLIDVVSTDHHTVKPWFAGKVDFAPPVKQLDASGYQLKGGRIDIVNARTAAVLVYQAGRHTVEVFIWPAQARSATAFQAHQLNGFNLRHWQENGFEVWCVSDMAAEELDTFASRWRAAS